jgi:hypothetical protein
MLVVGIFAAVVSCLSVVLGRRFIKALRAMRDDGQGWRDRWRALEPARRSAIVQTMRQGLPVTDPEDAELALRLVAQLDTLRVALRPLQLLATPAMVVLTIGALVSRIWFVAIIGGVSLVAGVVLETRSFLRRRRVHRSAEATRALIQR